MPLVKVKVAQLCPTLCDPMDYTVQWILYTRILEWVAFPFSRGSAQPRDQTQVSCIAGGLFTSWATRDWTWPKKKKELFLPDPSPPGLGRGGDSSPRGAPFPFWVFHPEVHSDQPLSQLLQFLGLEERASLMSPDVFLTGCGHSVSVQEDKEVCVR